MTPVPAGTDRLSAERLAAIEQQCCASYDAYHAAEWCHAANDLLAEVARLTQERDTLRASLEMYGAHKPECTYRWNYEGQNLRCSCGYHASLAASSPVAATTDEEPVSVTADQEAGDE